MDLCQNSVSVPVIDLIRSELIKCQVNNPTLLELNFGGRNLTDQDIVWIASSLGTNKSIHTIRLRGNLLGPNGVKVLSESLYTNTAVTALWLNGNKILSQGALFLAQIFATNKTLIVLVLNENSIDDAGAVALADAVRESTCLQSLFLGNNKITDVGASSFALAIEMCASLTELSLPCNQVGDKGAQELVRALRNNRTITDIDLFSNPISLALRKCLMVELCLCQLRNSRVQVLNMKSCHLDDGDVIRIAEHVKGATFVTQLILTDNYIGDKGALAMAEALKINTSLSILCLDENPYGYVGASALTAALKLNTTLVEFIGSGGPLPPLHHRFLFRMKHVEQFGLGRLELSGSCIDVQQLVLLLQRLDSLNRPTLTGPLLQTLRPDIECYVCTIVQQIKPYPEFIRGVKHLDLNRNLFGFSGVRLVLDALCGPLRYLESLFILDNGLTDADYDAAARQTLHAIDHSEFRHPGQFLRSSFVNVFAENSVLKRSLSFVQTAVIESQLDSDEKMDSSALAFFSTSDKHENTNSLITVDGIPIRILASYSGDALELGHLAPGLILFVLPFLNRITSLPQLKCAANTEIPCPLWTSLLERCSSLTIDVLSEIVLAPLFSALAVNQTVLELHVVMKSISSFSEATTLSLSAMLRSNHVLTSFNLCEDLLQLAHPTHLVAVVNALHVCAINFESPTLLPYRIRMAFRRGIGLTLPHQIDETFFLAPDPLNLHILASELPDFRLWQRVGSGQFGVVYRCEFQGREVCIKTIKSNEVADLESCYREFALVYDVMHQVCVLKLAGSFIKI